MATHKLQVEHFFDESFSLLALHCTIEDFRTAYYLNQFLGLKLKRSKYDLDFEYNKASYVVFDWEDEKNRTHWSLIGNVCKREEESLVSTGYLFENRPKIVRSFNLVPEFKNVNYFLKIENDGNAINERRILSNIQEIPQIAAVYSVDPESLRSKENLIF